MFHTSNTSNTTPTAKKAAKTSAKNKKKWLALGAASLAGLVAALAPLSPALAERIGGPFRTVDTVLEDYTDVYRLRFAGGRLAQIAAAGDIDIFVYDASGRLVAKDDLYDWEPAVQFYPRGTQTYTVRVVNEAAYDVDYAIATN